MAPDLLALEVEDYSSRPRCAAPSPTRAGAGVPLPALLALTAFLAAFVTLAVCLGQAAGAC